jgi:hypothetical protein
VKELHAKMLVQTKTEERTEVGEDEEEDVSSYWKLKAETLDSTLCRTRLGRGYGHVVGQTTKSMKPLHLFIISVNTTIYYIYYTTDPLY